MGLLCALAISPTVRAAPAAGESGSDPEAAAPSLEEDLQTVLSGRGRAYLAARGRLDQAPDKTRELVLTRLDALDRREAELRKSQADPTQSDAFMEIGRERGRLVALLTGVSRPEDAPRYAQQLKSALLEGRPVEPWRPLLLGLGTASVSQFATLVADTSLEQAARQSLLEDLVSITATGQLSALSAQLGQGERELEHTLRRALVRRARKNPAEAQALLDTLDQTWTGSGASSKRAAALLVRATIDSPPQWVAGLTSTAVDVEAPFELRIAALSILGKGDPSTRTPEDAAALRGLAVKHLAPERRAQQRSEILAWMSLQALPATLAAELIAQHKLLDARAPRLASWAWSAQPGSPSASALDGTLANPWPQVRASAMRRVQGPCAGPVRQRLLDRAGPLSGGGDADPAVARAAVEALGRCEEFAGLRKLLDNSGVSFEQRGSVARTLIVNDPGGLAFVAQRLKVDLAPQLAERYADALGAADPRTAKPADSVRLSLCRIESALPTASASARRSRKLLFPDLGCE